MLWVPPEGMWWGIADPLYDRLRAMLIDTAFSAGVALFDSRQLLERVEQARDCHTREGQDASHYIWDQVSTDIFTQYVHITLTTL